MKFEHDLGIEIPKNWEVVRIEDIGQVIGGGTPSTRQEEYYGGDISWITPKDLSRYRKKYIANGSRNITEKGLDNSSARLLPKNTVLLSSRAPIGYVAIAKNELCTNQGFKSVICDESKIFPDYLYYMFKISKRRLESIASGTTFKEISGKKVKQFKIPLPPLNEQLKIVKILNHLDSKLELNNQIIFNLEELAQTLFKHWFVDFEFPNEEGKPYKSSGGKMFESELGMIPEGWSFKKLNEVSKLIMGLSPKSSTYNEEGEGLPLLNGAADFNGSSLAPKRYTSDPKRISIKSDLILCIRATIGNLTYSDSEYALGRGVAAIRPYKREYSELLYHFVLRSINRLKAQATGSVISGLSKPDLENIIILVPDDKKLNKFHNVFSSIQLKQQQLSEENIRLVNIRDTLLPKLLSGEVELPDDMEVTDDV